MITSPFIPDGRIVCDETIPGGGMCSHVLRPHQTLRLTDLEGGANVGALFYNRDHLLDRLNLPDTLKAQHTVKLTTGHVLFSDMGHVLCSITADTCGWHDPLAGHSTSSLVQKKYGRSTFQEQRNDFYRNARDQFLIELGKWGLGKADLVANVNLFSKVTVDPDGRMRFEKDNSPPGAYIDLRAEMNVLAVLNTCPHPMDPFVPYRPRPVKLTVWNADPPTADDICRNSSPENARGFILTEALYSVGTQRPG
jgi:urea carboxylase-associated protein 2